MAGIFAIGAAFVASGGCERALLPGSGVSTGGSGVGNGGVGGHWFGDTGTGGTAGTVGTGGTAGTVGTGGTGGVSTGSGGTRSSGDAGDLPCTDLTLGAPIYSVSHVGHRPAQEAPVGGTIVDGTYDLVSVDFYTAAANETATSAESWTLRFSAGGQILEQVIFSEFNGDLIGRRWTVSTSGTTITMSLICGDSGSNPSVEEFSASPDRVVLTNPMVVNVFNRRN